MADQTVHSQFSVSGMAIGLTRKPLSPWGGLSLFAAFGEAVGLRNALDRGLAGLVRTSPNALSATDLLLGFMVRVLTGATPFLHLERLRGDAVLRKAFGISRFVVPTTYSRLFAGLPGQVREDLWSELLRWNLGLLDSFHGTETVMRILCLVHNLVQQFQDAIGMRPAHRPKVEGKRHTLETLRNRLFTCAAALGRSGRNTVLRLAASPPWWEAFLQALARVLPTQSNCRAAPESPAHPPLQFE
jgi:hypothetical protein